MTEDSPPALTLAQLTTLRRQIEELRRVNAQLRALKYLSRTGQALSVAGRGSGRGGRGSGSRGDSGRPGGRGRGRGRGGRGKRGREDESEADDSIVAGSSEEEGEAAVDSNGGSDGGYDTSDSAETSESEEDYTLPTVTQPRRTSRARRPSNASAAAGAMLLDQGSSSGDEGPVQQGGGSGDAQQQQQQGRALQLESFKPVQPRPPVDEAGGSIAGTGKGCDEEDTVCSVCGDGDAVESNAILLCDGKGCSVAVHQLCYGVRAVPAGKWLCEACKAKLKPSGANCCVCPVVGSAVKQVSSLGQAVPAGKAKSVCCHLACALWVPELELADHERMSGVRLDKLTAARMRLRCELCKQAGGGVVQCAFGVCCRSFHVLCGRGAGQLLTFRSDGEALAFCEVHSKPAFAQLVEEMVEGKRAVELRGSPLEH